MTNLNSKRPITVVIVFFLVLGVFALAMPVAHASPKSLYVCAEHHQKKFEAWNIKPDGTVEYQATYTLAYTSDPAGITIDESSATLFTTSEFSVGIEMFDAIGLTTVGYATAGLPSDLAGIDVDDANDIVYTVRRWTNLLYVLDWDPTAKTLTLKAGYPIGLPGLSQAFGCALDETTGILWVADSAAGVARAYQISTWTEDTSLSFGPSHKPVDITVDRARGFVYTVSMSAGAGVPAGCGSYLISKFDLATKTETTHNIGHQGVGIAVDEVTGYAYVTGSPTGTPPYDNLEVWDPSTWTQLQQTDDIGNPAGICVPQEEVAFNPLSLEKDDGLAEGQCVNPGDTITYTISFNNTNPYTVDNVVMFDNMSDYTTFVSATGGGGPYPWSHDPVAHSVTWDIGSLTTASPDSVTLVVTVNAGTPPGTEIINSATIKPILLVGGETTVVEKTLVCPMVVGATIESCDSIGTKKDEFFPGDNVYANGSGYKPLWNFSIYVVDDVTAWTDGMAIPPRVPGTAFGVVSDAAGNIPPWLVWSAPLTIGKYDIVVDVNHNGVYDAGVDALDDNDIQITAGFHVIPEYLLGTIMGLLACFAALAVFIRSKRHKLPLPSTRI